MYAIIHSIEPFDNAKGTTVSFTWNGNQIHKVRCIIKKNETGSIVYDKTVSTMKPNYTIESNSGLVNGTNYILYITVFDVDNKESDLQNTGMPFYCFSTPTFSLSIKNDQIIKASSYSTTLTYNQRENEELNTFEIILYTYQKIQLQTSGTRYDVSDMSYLLSGMEDGMQYYVRAKGNTIHGIILDTGYIPFTVAYDQKPVFTIMETNNKPEIGGIEIRSNISATEGIPDKDATYVDNKYVNLIDNSMTYDIGYEVWNDNSHVFTFNSVKANEIFAIIKDKLSNVIISLTYREGTFEDSYGKKGVVELSITENNITYVVYSNYFSIPSSSQNIAVCLSRINNYYDIKVVLVSRSTAI